MLPVLGALVSPAHNAVYHLVGPASALFLPALFNLFLLTALLSVLLGLARLTSRFGILVWSGIFFLMPWVLLKSLTVLYDLHLSHRISLSVFLVCVACVLASVLLWEPARATLFESGRRLGSMVLGLAAIFGIILTLQTCWFAFQARHLNDAASGTASAFGEPFASPPSAPLSPSRPRIIWIVFDEMSQDQAFDSRAPGLSLPNLDRFANQAIVFTRVIPAGIYTEMVFPALMGGPEGDAIRVSSDGRSVQLHQPADRNHAAAWNTFDQHKTIFAAAGSLGYNPAIVGWYNPYCRMLSGVLSSCFWTGESALSSMFPARTARENLFHPAARLLSDIPAFFFPRRFPSGKQTDMAKLHIADYMATSQAADAALTDPNLNFLLLHLPIPHPGGIYDRKSGALSTGKSSYIDNLALVDRYLGHVRELLEQQHAWDEATVIIMGDHSWRTQLLWEFDSAWSAEEQTASHGGAFDDRPFYALKLPNQITPQRIDRAFPAADTRALLLELLRRDITTSVQLEQWVQNQR